MLRKGRPFYLAGFTLLEILVVIGIITLLAGFIVARSSTARSFSRDTQRVSDLSIIQNAVNLYFVDNKNYPATIPSGPSGPLAKYLPRIPTDPRNGWPYRYVGINTDADPLTCESYHLGAKIENSRHVALKQDRDVEDVALTPIIPSVCTWSVADFDGSSTNSATCFGTSVFNPDTCFDLAP